MAAAAATAASSIDEAKAKSVLRQVEFYFSDSNLPRDKFLRETVEQREDGLVSLALICSFARMKSHLGLDAAVKPETVPEETVLAVAEVLRCSPVLRVSEDGKMVGRASELLKADEIIDQVDSRTVAASPLPYNVKLEDVQSFFAQHAKVNSVRLPRHITNKRHFCGTALVEFSEEEEAKSVLEKNLFFAGANLEIKPNYPKGLIVAFKLKRIMVDGAVQPNSADNDTATEEGTPNSMKKTSAEGSEECATANSDMEEQKPSDDMTEVKEVNAAEAIESGDKCTIDALPESEKKGDNETLSKDDRVLSGNANSPISREDLKETFKKFGTVRYADFSIGDDSGYLRFEDPKAAEKARMSAVLADEGGLIVKDHIVTLEPVTGEAEKDYWNTIRGIQGKYKDNRSYKGRAGKNYKGGKQFNGKRGRHSDSSDKGSNKTQKVEAVA
uniref:HTH La-type RNA-binding domain-containing protein n=1 Tax=Oryza punctata TaxID=4537 RepID=A0A0E0K295_ORYPU